MSESSFERMHAGLRMATTDKPAPLDEKLQQKEKKFFETSETESEALQREGRVYEKILEVEESFLDADHEVTAYVQARLDYLFPDLLLKARVAGNQDEPNALSLPNGTILVTKGLLALIDSQDELDFVLSHEAVHYAEGHHEELRASINDAKDRYQSSAAARSKLTSAVRLLGRRRLNEWEADVRGVVSATKGKVNPSAARSFFMKLDRYQQQTKQTRGITHGATLDRIINLGIAAQLADFESSSKPLEKLPERIKEFSLQPSENNLYEQIVLTEGTMSRAIIEGINAAGPNELILTLRRLHARGTEGTQTMFTGKVPGTEDLTGPEIYPKVYALALKNLERHIAKTFPEAPKKQLKFLLQAILEICIGIDTETSTAEVLSGYIDSLDDASSEKKISERMALLNPETFAKLGIVVPWFGDAAKFVGTVLRSVNQNEIFVDDENAFSVERYVDFAATLAQRVRGISAAHGFEPVSSEQVTKGMVSEALLNVDFKTDKFEKIKKIVLQLRDAFEKTGMTLSARATIEAVQEQPHTKLEAPQVAELRQELLHSFSYAALFEEFYQFNRQESGKRNQEAREIHEIHGSDWYFEIQFTFSAVTQPTEEYTKQGEFVLNDRYDKDFEKFNQFVHKMYQKAAITGVSQLKAFLEELFRYGEQVYQKSLRKMSVFVEEDKEDARYRLVLDAYWEEASAAIVSSLLYKGADFLPQDNFERFKVLAAMLHSGDNEILRRVLVPLVYKSGEISKQMKFKLSFFKDILALLRGNDAVYADNGFNVNKFNPNKLAFRKGVAIGESDDEIIFLLCEVFYEALGRAIDQGEVATKTRLLSELELFCGSVFKSLYTMLPAPKLLQTIFDHFDFDLEDEIDQEILLYCGSLLPSPAQRANLHDAVLKRKVKSSNFDAQLDLLFTDPRTKLSMTKDAKERFIEETVQTHEEVGKTTSVFENNISLIKDTETIGSAVLFETIMDISKDKKELFTWLMDMSNNDKKVKSAIFSFIRQKDRTAYDAVMSDEGAILETEQRIEELVSCNDMIRYVLVKELLLGNKGLLLTPDGRQWMLDYLLTNFVSAAETLEQYELSQTLTEVLETMVQEADADMLFFSIAPVLHSHMMRRPREQEPWERILMRCGYENKAEAKKTVRNVTQIRQGREVEVLDLSHRLSGHSSGDTVFVKTLPYSDKIQSLLQSEEFDEGVVEPWTTEEFAIKLVESFGSPGARFLQILGQYAELSPEMQANFKDVYDNTKSQTKITAYYTAKREWPQFPESVGRMVRRLGGGSLMSTYLCEMGDGTFEVMKVLSPNALMNLDFSMRVLRATLAKLSSQKPEKYRAALLALDDVEKWIRQDINYDTFTEQDKRFRAKHHKKSLAGHAYQLYVPESKTLTQEEKDNKYIKREEFIDGVTLNRFQGEPQEVKQVASIIVKNYFEQLVDGQVHSDVHPGNFMIFERDGQKYVAIIDRNNYLEIGDFLSVVQSFSGDPRQAVDALVEYSYAQSSTPRPKDWENIRERLRDKVSALAQPADMVQLVSKVMLYFKQETVPVPLSLTLLVKNFFGLQSIARNAGFTSVQEALAYQP